MGIAYNPRIVTDGLVLALDAGNRKSYPGSGTTWTDLSGRGNNGTLTNGPTFSSSNGGSIVFDGTNDFVDTSLITEFSDFTVCVWFKQSGSIKAYQRLVDKNYINGFWLGRENTNANKWGGGVRDSAFPFGRYITLNDNQWHFIVSRREGTAHTIFGDGVTNTISGTVSSSPLSLNNILIGKSDQVAQDLFTGNIASVQIYNRALTSTEIQQNFNATRGRYGI
jgi:hypothetical protein